MKNNLWNKLLRAHIIGILLSVLNALVKCFSSYGLHSNLETGLKLFIVVSGLALFFYYAIKMKRLNLYFSIYPLGVLILIVSLIFRNLFLGMIVSIILFPVLPDNVLLEENNVSVSRTNGFMVPCCEYIIKERKYLIFEKTYPPYNPYESIDFSNVHIDNNPNGIEVWKFGNQNEKVKTLHRIFKK